MTRRFVRSVKRSWRNVYWESSVLRHCVPMWLYRWFWLARYHWRRAA